MQTRSWLLSWDKKTYGFVLCLLLALVFFHCSQDNSLPLVCNANELQNCLCDGKQGWQSCNAEGSEWEPCKCTYPVGEKPTRQETPTEVRRELTRESSQDSLGEIRRESSPAEKNAEVSGEMVSEPSETSKEIRRELVAEESFSQELPPEERRSEEVLSEPIGELGKEVQGERVFESSEERSLERSDVLDGGGELGPELLKESNPIEKVSEALSEIVPEMTVDGGSSTSEVARETSRESAQETSPDGD